MQRRVTWQRPDVLDCAGSPNAERSRAHAAWRLEFAANWLDSRHFETYNSVDRDSLPRISPTIFRDRHVRGARQVFRRSD